MTKLTSLHWLGSPVRPLRDALITFGVLLLMFAAYDDITTDKDTDFRLEYAALMAGAAWLAYVAVRLIKARHRALGGISLVVLAVALWAVLEMAAGPTPGMWPAYVAVIGAFLWFVALTGILVALHWRSHSARQPDLTT